jgi:hypothetical protein
MKRYINQQTVSSAVARITRWNNFELYSLPKRILFFIVDEKIPIQ